MEPSASALVIVTMACLLLVYVVPHAISRRQRLLDARTDDRFSPDLRVVAISHVESVGELTLGGCPDSVGLEEPRRGYVLHAHAARVRKEMAVLRPYGVDDRAAARAASHTQELRRQLADIHQRRVAGVRHRQVLTAIVAIAVIAGVVAVPVWSISVVFPVVAALLLIGILVAGHRATVGWQLQETQLRSAIGRAEAETQRLQVAAARRRRRPAVTATVPDFPERATAAKTMVEADEASADWTPVPVPVPTYNLKPRAPRIVPGSVTRDGRVATPRTATDHSGGARASLDPARPVPVRRAVDTGVLKATTPNTAPVAVSEARVDTDLMAGGSSVQAAESDEPAGRPAEPRNETIVAARDAGAREAHGTPEPVEKPTRRPLPVPESTGGFDLNLVLSRRRASGQ